MLLSHPFPHFDSPTTIAALPNAADGTTTFAPPWKMRTTHPPLPLHYILCLLLFSAAAPAAGDNIYAPVDNFAVNCGYRGGPVASQSGRKWSPDSPSPFMPSQYLKSSSASTASTQDYVPQIPCMTARVSRTAFAYSFPVATAGTKFVRLHFHSASYSGGFLPSAAAFSVTVNGRYSLLRNFSAALAARSLKRSYFVKEFIVTVASPPLNITFAPTPGSIAFVNGVEVVSMPSDLYGEPRSIDIIGLSGHQTLLVENTMAMETVYRLNIDGQELLAENDTGMFRSWSEDVSFILGAESADTGQDPYNSGLKIVYTKVPNYTAPEMLYRTARSIGMVATDTHRNLTWVFPVDSGFYYLVRFHFCETAPEITQRNQRVFEIYVNNGTADDQMDIMVYAGAIGVPIYREFVVMVPKGQQDLWVALRPNTKDKPKYPDALLNGLEIFKLSQSDGNLAGPNPEPVRVSNSSQQPRSPTDQSSPSSGPKRRNMMWVVVLVGVMVVLGSLVASMLYVVSLWRRRGGKSSKEVISGGGWSRSRWWCPLSPAASGSYISKTSSNSKSLPSDRCRHFTLAEIRAATDDFNDARVIGLGGFGKVYKGTIAAEDGDVAVVHVAIKRLNPSSRQGAHEFRTEIEMLSQLRHRHLVSLIGYCEDHREMILVYDHMANGALRSHLYASRCGSSSYDNCPPRLTWKQRLEICVGAARGLLYLHAGAKHPIIHRDVKTTNILLDHKWVAKVSDFGLSRFGPSDLSRTHVSTEVKGSFGYLDPEYYRRQQLTAKSDVYSFGVVLFEVLCARAPLDPNLLKDEMNLSEWAGSHYRNGKLDRIVDPSVRNQIAPECLYKYGEIACRCVHEKGIERPSMAEVVWNLEFALQLQESAEEGSGLQGRLMMDGYGEHNPKLFSWYSLSGSGSGCGSGSGSGTASWYCSSNATNKEGMCRADDSGLGLSGSVFSELVSPRGR